jgi:hypothetical protein
MQIFRISLTEFSSKTELIAKVFQDKESGLVKSEMRWEGKL